MDLDGRTRQFFSVLSERLKEKGFSSRIADDGCLAVKSKKMRGKEQTQCSVGKDGEVIASGASTRSSEIFFSFSVTLSGTFPVTLSLWSMGVGIKSKSSERCQPTE